MPLLLVCVLRREEERRPLASSLGERRCARLHAVAALFSNFFLFKKILIRVHLLLHAAYAAAVL